MTLQASTTRPGKSVGAAGLGILLTLLVFVAVFVAFLLAPLAVLLVAFLAYTVMRPREGGKGGGATGGDAAAPGGQAPHGFGAGTQ